MGEASKKSSPDPGPCDPLVIAINQLKIDEGEPGTGKPLLEPYKDSLGYWTLGWGRKLRAGEEVKFATGITWETAERWLSEDALTAQRDAQFVIGSAFDSASPRRQAALINMAFNLGQTRLRGFRVMIEMIRQGRWSAAAHAAENSLWHSQVGWRAVRIEEALLLG